MDPELEALIPTPTAKEAGYEDGYYGKPPAPTGEARRQAYYLRGHAEGCAARERLNAIDVWGRIDDNGTTDPYYGERGE